MLTVTDSAKQYLKKLLLDSTNEPDIGLRLTMEAGQIGLVLNREAPGDHVIEHEGSKVLLVAQELTTMLVGVTLDTQDTPDGPSLVISRGESK